MSFSKQTPLVTISYFLIIFSLFIRKSTAQQTNPLYHICFNKENYTSYSPFASNLHQLTNYLTTKVPPTGFGLGSVGQANGLALCRGDAKPEACKSCVANAAKHLKTLCPYNKGAVIWYDTCLFKYSNEYFFKKIDMSNRFALLNVNSVDDPESFNRKVSSLVTGLARKASESPRLYATGELGLGAGPDRKLYGLAQCTRDLSGVDCKKCLDEAISYLPGCCAGKRGGRVVSASCYVRYELYPIVDA